MVKKYVMDETLSWEERYKQLDAHHVEETTALVAKLEKYKAAFENLVARIDRDGGHAQAGKTLEENLKRADERVVELLSTYERLVGSR